MSKEINVKITKEDLRKFFDNRASTLVGKVLKRFDISNNIDNLKLQVKELIYEEFRVIESLFELYNRGIEYQKNNPDD